jgi:hypothetical protein
MGFEDFKISDFLEGLGLLLSYILSLEELGLSKARTQDYCIGPFREVIPTRSARDQKLMLALGGGSYLDRNPNLRMIN